MDELQALRPGDDHKDFQLPTHVESSSPQLTTASVAAALGLESTSTWDEILERVQLRHETELLFAIQTFMEIEG